MKNILFLLLFTFFYSIAHSQLKEKIRLNEEFNDNKNNWYLYTKAEGSVEMKYGALVIENKDTLRIVCSIPVDIDTSADLRIITSPRMISGDNNYGYGFFFGGSDKGDLYYFQIASGYFLFGKFENGKDNILINWTKSATILSGYDTGNILMLRKEKGLWSFYSNGQLVTSFKALPFYGKEMGLFVGGAQKVSFEHLMVINLYP